MSKRDEQELYVLSAIVAVLVLHTLIFAWWSIAQVRTHNYEVELPKEKYTIINEAIVIPVPQGTISDDLAQHEAQMPLFGYDYEYVVGVVAAECCGEPYEGQLAVVQCIVNTAKSRGLSPEEVVKLPNRYAEPVTDSNKKDLVRDACCDGIVLGYCATDEPIEYFYSTRNGGYSAWHEENLEFVIEIGNHRFFKEVNDD